MHGVGLWSPGFPDAASWCAGEPKATAREPAAALLEGALRRRATLHARMAAEAFEQAGRQSGADLETVPTIWATAHGEHETAVAILAMMGEGEGRVSPTRFHNSVYNTPAGYASIALGNRAFSTTLAGGPDLAAMALFEAGALLGSGVHETIVVLADEPLVVPFDADGAEAPLAVALALSSRAEGASARLADLRPQGAPRVERRPPFGGLYISAVLPLAEACIRGESTRVGLELACGRGEDGRGWCVDVSPR